MKNIKTTLNEFLNEQNSEPKRCDISFKNSSEYYKAYRLLLDNGYGTQGRDSGGEAGYFTHSDTTYRINFTIKRSPDLIELLEDNGIEFYPTYFYGEPEPYIPHNHGGYLD